MHQGQRSTWEELLKRKEVRRVDRVLSALSREPRRLRGESRRIGGKLRRREEDVFDLDQEEESQGGG